LLPNPRASDSPIPMDNAPRKRRPEKRKADAFDLETKSTSPKRQRTQQSHIGTRVVALGVDEALEKARSIVRRSSDIRRVLQRDCPELSMLFEDILWAAGQSKIALTKEEAKEDEAVNMEALELLVMTTARSDENLRDRTSDNSVTNLVYTSRENLRLFINLSRDGGSPSHCVFEFNTLGGSTKSQSTTAQHPTAVNVTNWALSAKMTKSDLDVNDSVPTLRSIPVFKDIFCVSFEGDESDDAESSGGSKDDCKDKKYTATNLRFWRQIWKRVGDDFSEKAIRRWIGLLLKIVSYAERPYRRNVSTAYS